MYSLTTTTSINTPSLVLPTRVSSTTKRSVGIRRNKHQNGHRLLTTTAAVKSQIVDNKAFVEKTAGRTAMLGFVTGTSIMASTGMGYVEQLQYDSPFALLIVATIIYASYVTADVELSEYKPPFTKSGELLNGRVSMLGVASRFIYEYFMQAM